MSTSKKLNQGIIKLTKENINDGHLGDKIKSISGSDKVLSNGFHRSFCMKTHLGRGSFKNPGLMLGLDQGGSCRGSAYKLNRNDAIKNIDILFKREMVTGAYKPKLLKTKLDNEQIVSSLAFTVDKKHKNYFNEKNTSIKASMISKANGFLGTCKEYFEYTLESLEELDIIDKEMRAISLHLKNN